MKLHENLLSIGLLCLLAGAAGAEVWGIKTPASITEPPSTLFRFAEDGSELAVIGPVTVAGDSVPVDGLAIRDDGLLCGHVLVFATSQLVVIDPATAVATPVGAPLAARRIRGAAFTPTGELLTVDAEQSALVEIDPETGLEAGPAVPFTLDGQPFAPGTSCDLAVDAAGLVLLCAGELTVYTVDRATGALGELFTDTVPGEDTSPLSGAGLAIGESEAPRLFVFDINREDDIYSYALAGDHARQLEYGDILSDYNAGRGDLAARATGTVSAVPMVAARSIQLLPNQPNPFNPRTTLRFELAKPGAVDLRLYDVAGRLVRTLCDGREALPAGRHAVAWDGTDDGGRQLPSGVYLGRLSAGGETTARALTLLE